MSIQSTLRISRDFAVHRIIEIYVWKVSKNYVQVEKNSFEPDEDLQQFVDQDEEIDISDIQNWSCSMLERQMDKPFYRCSMFNNYVIVPGDETW